MIGKQGLKWQSAMGLILICCLGGLTALSAQADTLLVAIGAGAQPGASQHNRLVSIDYNFYRIDRSARSSVSLGITYTKLKTDTDFDTEIEAFSIYPQLTLRPLRRSMKNMYFFVKALGPTYISSNRLGTRQQANHFAFQAELGLGYEKAMANDGMLLLEVSWRHFSNANFFGDNDGIDVPFIFSMGLRF